MNTNDMERDARDAVSDQDRAAPVDSSGDEPRRALSPQAKSIPHIADRNRSSKDYARFAAAAGTDILVGGEPIEGFLAVGKIDDRLLRARAQELREDQFLKAHEKRPRSMVE